MIMDYLSYCYSKVIQNRIHSEDTAVLIQLIFIFFTNKTSEQNSTVEFEIHRKS